MRFHNYYPTAGETARLLLDGLGDQGVTVKEAARRLGCSRSTVRLLISQGRLSAHLIGGGVMRRHFRVAPASLLRFGRSACAAPLAAPASTAVDLPCLPPPSTDCAAGAAAAAPSPSVLLIHAAKVAAGFQRFPRLRRVE
jgi:excisionase family DNA binding protein